MSERIERAAIEHDGRVWELPRPARHHDVIRHMSEQGLGPEAMHNQGFITSTGRFVDRVAGCQIARDAGQIMEKSGPEHKLFSEDMW